VALARDDAKGKCVVHTGTFTAADATFYVHKQREAICGKGLTMPMNWIFPATLDSKLMGGFPVHYMTCLVGRNIDDMISLLELESQFCI
jgi:hypothetical protein